MKEVLLYVAQAVASVVSCPYETTEDRTKATVIIDENILPGEDVEVQKNNGVTEIYLDGEYIFKLKEEKRK